MLPGNVDVALTTCGIGSCDTASLLQLATAVTPAIVVAVDAAVVAAAAAAAATDADDAVIRLQESSLCHLELFCSAALICVHSSFLHDFERLMDCSQSLNCALPSGVI